ncbi:phosphoribosylaminoimidazolesuccinocarboxamide synthase [Leptolyngbyaceae cyanobacterium CCMR0082]|uniref:Phosphoribosylaminoimidazole-succinocarboxamide synthase n=1 Tax=Adonisia turfae CCMR0082 TaxID=2304604 RepID=A0A6M0RZS2_9CYAN|nr:phosphoribosylaminoimidazolesuccinocarboxamide synthase [Adonisia turfae]MDV3352126.1 phosphoribosylaminoimidazolesuccinocarboxamide synthase [Leptothoe sp. LEGE 181152]NEZ61719.1 phosphoribosylaminoimidazolesuccinocarboxamide synthase [Adonisia turfae CCMR0082]
MAERKKLYEGKAKILYATEDPAVLVTYFKDDATAFNAQKRGTIANKGCINNAVSTHLFKLLEAQGVTTHWIASPNEREMWVKPVTIVPLEVVVRNLAAGSLCRQTGLALGTPLTPPLVEFYYKNDDLGDPLLTCDRIRAMDIASDDTVTELDRMARSINQILKDFFNSCSITLVDFKLEFGTLADGTLVLADEISPDTCRLWNQEETDESRRVMDKDRFRQDLGDVESGYQQVLDRILAHTN